MEEGLVVAPAEGTKPVSILNDKFRNELGHPHLFPTDQYGKVEKGSSIDSILIKVSYTTLKTLLQTMMIYCLNTLFYTKFNLAAD